MGGSTLYVNKRKAKNFYQSARLQLPMEGKRFFDLFGSSIKTEEDLVKFKLQKEEEKKGQDLLPVRRASIAPGG